MAEKRAFDKTRAAQRRLALLMLSGDQPGPATPCPEPTELAALVEGRLAPPRVEACLAHLAGCDRCCALWLQLDRESQDRTGTGRRGQLLRLVSRPRVLVAAGSLLAAAASLALVLTLTLQADRTTLTRLPEKPAEEQSLATPGADSAVLAESGASPVATVPPPATSEQQAHGVERLETASPKAAGSAQPRSREAKRANAVVRDRVATAEPDSPAADVQAPPPSGQSEVARRAKAPLSLSGWQDHIRTGCTGQPDAAFFAGVRDQGKTLLADPTGLNELDRHQIEGILALLTQPQPADDHCRAMLDLLGPAALQKSP